MDEDLDLVIMNYSDGSDSVSRDQFRTMLLPYNK